jgi:hypothetical protein
MDEPNRKSGNHSPDKVQRLAEALRENLRKRKTQARARRDGARNGAECAKGDTPGEDTGTGENC